MECNGKYQPLTGDTLLAVPMTTSCSYGSRLSQVQKYKNMTHTRLGSDIGNICSIDGEEVDSCHVVIHGNLPY